MNRDWLPLKTTPWTLGLALLLMFLLAETTALPQRIDYWLLDSTLLARPAAASPNIAIVAIDDLSLAQQGRWPWPRRTHAALIKKLHRAGAKTIVFDILFTEPSSGDAALKRAMQAHGKVILPLHLSPSSSRILLSEQLPSSELVNAATSLGHAHVELDQDGIARGLYQFNGMGHQLWPSLALAASGTRPRKPDTQGLPPFVNVRDDYRIVPLTGEQAPYLLIPITMCLTRPQHRMCLVAKPFLLGPPQLV